MREPTDSQLALASRIDEACEQCDLILFKRRNVPNNFAMRPALALAVALYPHLAEKTREGPVAEALDFLQQRGEEA